MHEAQNFLDDQQMRKAIVAIEGTYPPLHNYAVEWDGGKLALFTQFSTTRRTRRYYVLFTWWGDAIVTNVEQM